MAKLRSTKTLSLDQLLIIFVIKDELAVALFGITVLEL